MKKYNQGITLIALVITIIILLILAGVSIAMLTGQNGILTQAQNSKVVTTQSKVEEMTNLAIGALRTEKLNDTSKITPQDIVNQINKDNNRTDVTASSTTFPSDMIFENEGIRVTVNLDLTVGDKNSGNDNKSSLYPEDIDESKIAPAELFNFEPITETSSNSKVASTNTTTNLSQKEARITGIKIDYCSYDETNYKINYPGITDTLIIPYQVKIGDEMYKVTEVKLEVKGLEYEGGYIKSNLPAIQNIIYPNTVKTIKVSEEENVEAWEEKYAEVWEEKDVDKVVLSDNIEEIPERYFCNAGKLKEVKLPENLKKIGDKSFFYCSSLSKITYKGTTYTSKSALVKALNANGVNVSQYVFDDTALSD